MKNKEHNPFHASQRYSHCCDTFQSSRAPLYSQSQPVAKPSLFNLLVHRSLGRWPWLKLQPQPLLRASHHPNLLVHHAQNSVNLPKTLLLVVSPKILSRLSWLLLSNSRFLSLSWSAISILPTRLCRIIHFLDGAGDFCPRQRAGSLSQPPHQIQVVHNLNHPNHSTTHTPCL